MKGELCASAGIGEEPTSNAARARQGSVERIDARYMAASLRLAHAACARGHTRRGLPAPRLELLPLGGTRSSEAEAVHDEGVVVLLLALLVGPVVGAHPRLDDELIALARIAGDRLTQRSERDEPQAGDDLARGTLFALAGVVVAHQAEARVAGVVLGRQFRVASEIADRGQREAVHRDGSLLPSVGPGGSAVSLFTRPMIGIAIRRLFVQKCGQAAPGSPVRVLARVWLRQGTRKREWRQCHWHTRAAMPRSRSVSTSSTTSSWDCSPTRPRSWRWRCACISRRCCRRCSRRSCAAVKMSATSSGSWNGTRCSTMRTDGRCPSSWRTLHGHRVGRFKITDRGRVKKIC